MGRFNYVLRNIKTELLSVAAELCKIAYLNLIYSFSTQPVPCRFFYKNEYI